jgi:WD40 repeat protein
VYDMASEQPLADLRSHEKDVRCVALSEDGKYAYSASPDRHAVWDVSTGRPATEAGQNGVVCATFLPRATVLVFAYQTGAIATTDLRVGVRFGDFEDRHRDAITCLAVSPGGSYVVAADADRAVRGWEPFARRQRWEVTDLPEAVTTAAFAPDNRRFVTATARTWAVWE